MSSLFTPINTPKLTYVPEFKNFESSVVIRTDHLPYLKELGLESMAGTFEILTAWLAPHGSISIHKDTDPRGLPIAWSIVICPESCYGVTVELYQANPTAKLTSSPAPSGKHRVQSVEFNDAELIEDWPLTQGSVIFNPGSTWHSARNTTDQWQNCVTLRSDKLSVLKNIKKIFERN